MLYWCPTNRQAAGEYRATCIRPSVLEEPSTVPAGTGLIPVEQRGTASWFLARRKDETPGLRVTPETRHRRKFICPKMLYWCPTRRHDAIRISGYMYPSACHERTQARPL